MENRSAQLTQQSRNLLIFLVVVGYIITFIMVANGDKKFIAFQIVMGILFGAVYFVISMFDTEFLQPISEYTQNVVHFSISPSLVFFYRWEHGTRGTPYTPSVTGRNQK